MSAPSLSARPSARRVPVQDRAERRVASLLNHAEAVIARVGYEAATMKEIAAKSKASIGSVYQYFPNKEAITMALCRKFAKELIARWESLEAETSHLNNEQLGAEIIEQFIRFANEQPGFFPSLAAPIKVRTDPALRLRLRELFAALFLKRNPSLSEPAAMQVAIVTLQTVKGLVTLCGEAKPKERRLFVTEHKALLSAYLGQRLASTAAKANP